MCHTVYISFFENWAIAIISFYDTYKTEEIPSKNESNFLPLSVNLSLFREFQFLRQRIVQHNNSKHTRHCCHCGRHNNQQTKWLLLKGDVF